MKIIYILFFIFLSIFTLSASTCDNSNAYEEKIVKLEKMLQREKDKLREIQTDSDGTNRQQNLAFQQQTKDKQAVETKLHKLEQEKLALEKQLRENTPNNEIIDTLQKKLNESQSKFASSENLIETLREDLKNSKAEQATAKQSLADTKKQLQKLKLEFDQQRMNFTALKQKQEKLENSISESIVNNRKKFDEMTPNDFQKLEINVEKLLNSPEVSPKKKTEIIKSIANDSNKLMTVKIYSNIIKSNQNFKDSCLDSLMQNGVDNKKEAEDLLEAGSLLMDTLAEINSARQVSIPFFVLLREKVQSNNFSMKKFYDQLKYASQKDISILIDRIRMHSENISQETIQMFDFLLKKTKNSISDTQKSQILGWILNQQQDELQNKALVLLLENNAPIPDDFPENKINTLIRVAYGNWLTPIETTKKIHSFIESKNYLPSDKETLKAFLRGENYLSDENDPNFIITILNKFTTSNFKDDALKIMFSNTLESLLRLANRVEEFQVDIDKQRMEKLITAIKNLIENDAYPNAKTFLMETADGIKGGRKFLSENRQLFGLSAKDFE